MKYYFNTLNEALASEGLLHTLDTCTSSLYYGETMRYFYNDIVVIVSRVDGGKYERPVHYKVR